MFNAHCISTMSIWGVTCNEPLIWSLHLEYWIRYFQVFCLLKGKIVKMMNYNKLATWHMFSVCIIQRGHMQWIAIASNFIAYCIAENFCEEKLLQNAHLYCQWMPCPQNFAEKTLANSHKTSKFVKLFSLKGFLLHGMLCRICIVELCMYCCVCACVLYFASDVHKLMPKWLFQNPK